MEGGASGTSRKDVYLSFLPEKDKSFTGEVLRAVLPQRKDELKTFTDKLCAALQKRNIRTLIREEEIKDLSEIMNNSQTMVPIFWTGYAESKWCLKEVAQMVRMTKNIFPVFFDVNRSVVKNQSGPYAAAFRRHMKNETEETVNEWRYALNRAANIPGVSLADMDSLGQVCQVLWLASASCLPRGEAQFVEHVVEMIERRLNMPISQSVPPFFKSTSLLIHSGKSKAVVEEWVVNIENKYISYNAEEYEEKMKKRSIYKWPNDLIQSSLSRYSNPCMISFGPYHHGKAHLQKMEHHKGRALFRILHRSGGPELLPYFIDSLKEIEEELRDNYGDLDPEELESDRFLQMMLLDGCFLLEFLRINEPSQYSSSSDVYEPMFSFNIGRSTIVTVKYDMLVLENQIPLLVLNKLLMAEQVQGREITNEEKKEKESKNYDELHSLISKFYFLPKPVNDRPSLHILDIYRKSLIMTKEESTPVSGCLSHREQCLHLALEGLTRMLITIPILVFLILNRRRISEQGHTRSATRLHEGGIKFKLAKPKDGKVTFDEKNGLLTLPAIEITDYTAIIYMNLIAFERMHPGLAEQQEVTNNVIFMNELIDTPEDVSLLSSRGIVRNFLGSDEDAAKLFNTLGIGHASYPSDLRKQLETYVSSDWHKAEAYLNLNYFKNPWSVTSLLAAIIFFGLTFIQTVFTIKSFKHDNGKS